MSIVASEGVYMLTSKDVTGKTIYKIGRSDNLKQRLGSYPPNWCLLDCLPCKDSIKVEKMLIDKFRSKMKIYSRNEYFECDLNCIEVKKFFNDVLNSHACGSSSGAGLKKDVPKEKTRDDPKKGAGKDVPKEKTRDDPKKGAGKVKKNKYIMELREEVLDTCDDLLDKATMKSIAQTFNEMIDGIMKIQNLDIKQQEKVIYDLLAGVVSKKNRKEAIRHIINDDISLVSKDMKILMSEINKLY